MEPRGEAMGVGVSRPRQAAVVPLRLMTLRTVAVAAFTTDAQSASDGQPEPTPFTQLAETVKTPPAGGPLSILA